MSIPALPTDWTDFMACERNRAHTKALINNSVAWDPKLMSKLRYISELIGLHCGPDMLAMRLFPNAKEITESLAAYRAILNYGGFQMGDPDVTLIAVGDGSTPRTAATFAFRSRWQCYSVDPNLKGGSLRWSNVERLTVVPKRIQEFKIRTKRAVIVAVHSHANLADSIAAVDADELVVMAMPCCVRLELDRVPDREYRDSGIMSPQNLIRIWKSGVAA